MPDLKEIRIAPINEPKKQIHAGFLSHDKNSFNESIDVTRAILISVIAFVEPGKYVPLKVGEKVYRIAVTEHEDQNEEPVSRIISPSSAN